jgi:hypothetical protein
MTEVTLTLPDELARQARQAGLLKPDALETLLRDAMRSQRLERLRAARKTLADDPLPPMTTEEIQAEIRAYRTGQRRAPGA